MWQTVFVSTISFSRSPRGSLPQWRGASSSGTTISSSRPLDLKLPDNVDPLWLSQGGREMAAAYLLPRAEVALRQELQRLADAVKRARQGQSSSSSGWRAL